MSVEEFQDVAGVTHQICKFDGATCETGLEVRHLAEDFNVESLEESEKLNRTFAAQDIAMQRLLSAAIAVNPRIEPFISGAAASTGQQLESLRFQPQLCRAVCKGRGLIQGCRAKLEDI